MWLNGAIYMLLLVIIEERESVNIMVVMLGREVGQMCAERIYLDSSSRMTYFNSAILIDDLVELRSGFLSLGPGHMKGEPFILKNLLYPGANSDLISIALAGCYGASN
jgi:hypothetical protein